MTGMRGVPWSMVNQHLLHALGRIPRPPLTGLHQGGCPAAGVPVAAGVLYPFFGMLLSPVLAATAMALSSVSVIANSLRLRMARIG